MYILNFGVKGLTLLDLAAGGTNTGNGFRLRSGLGQSIKLEVPMSLPSGLLLVKATLGGASHQGVVCAQATVSRGARFGPYRGRVIQPTELVPGADYLYMWEVSGCCQ